MYKIEIDNEFKILRNTHKGLTSLRDLGSAWSEILQTNEVTHQSYNILSDYSEAEFDFSISEMDIILNFLESFKHILNGKREAVVAIQPFITALTILFEHTLLQKMNFKVKAFSDKDIALNWLTFRS